ncbi:TetR/AcrR family transcriptional regulator [Acerihabitans sp. KWT182]|uniref:TetR/AcrR family transcriptional regulator n=1 Tax=Acerihabitans sp. KWT182 TaxID=3157919 RepID=A0AAU7Q8W7_9GAMM
MPRVSQAEAKHNRVLIEDVSATLFREKGLKVSVADVMAAAGLTHGGFYGHFASKDELIAIACENAFKESAGRWRANADAVIGAGRKQSALVENYLSLANISNSGHGCPLAALAADVAREGEDKPVRKAFCQGLEELVQIYCAGTHERSQALAAISTLVGALVLARANSGYAIAEELLTSAKNLLLKEIESSSETKCD